MPSSEKTVELVGPGPFSITNGMTIGRAVTCTLRCAYN